MKFLISLVLLVSPTVLRAATPPAALSALTQLTKDGEIVKKVLDELPAWEQNDLGKFEREELSAVRLDIDACKTAVSPDDFFIDFEKLKIDLGTLIYLDDQLNRNGVI